MRSWFTRKPAETADPAPDPRAVVQVAWPDDVDRYAAGGVQHAYKAAVNYRHDYYRYAPAGLPAASPDAVRLAAIKDWLTGEGIAPADRTTIEALVGHRASRDATLADLRARADAGAETVVGVAAAAYNGAMTYLARTEEYPLTAYQADASLHDLASDLFTGAVRAAEAVEADRATLRSIERARQGLGDTGVTSLDADLNAAEVAAEESRARNAAAVRMAGGALADLAVTRCAQALAVAETVRTQAAIASARTALERAEHAAATDTDERIVRISAVAAMSADRTVGMRDAAEAEITRQQNIRRTL